MTIEHVNRLIHYYELSIDFNSEFIPPDGYAFRELFMIVTKLAKEKHAQRYQVFGEKIIFIHEIAFNPTQKVIYGKLRCIRKDLFPEIMNTLTDEPRDIEATEEEGIVETTHFVISYGGKKQHIALEYNLYGAKINDFAQYIEKIGINNSALTKVKYIPIVRNQLASIQGRIIRCAEFEIKIHKDNIEALKDIDIGTYTAMKASIDQFHNEYGTLVLNFDYKKKTATPEINNTIFKFVKVLLGDNTKVDLFDKLKVVAEDTDKNNKLEAFDLLIDKVKSNIRVEKKAKHRSIVSTDMFDKIYSELNKKHLL